MTGDILELQEDASVFKVVLALVIILINSLSVGTAVAFSTTAAVVYKNQNTTTLPEVLDEDQTSWLSKFCRNVVMSISIFETTERLLRVY